MFFSNENFGLEVLNDTATGTEEDPSSRKSMTWSDVVILDKPTMAMSEAKEGTNTSTASLDVASKNEINNSTDDDDDSTTDKDGYIAITRSGRHVF